MHPVALMLSIAGLFLVCFHDAVSDNEFQLGNEEVLEASRAFSNPCAPDPCRNGGRCAIKIVYQSHCVCEDGFKGEHCEITKSKPNPCTPNLCQNSGTCVAKPDGSPYCKCREGSEGERCEKTMRVVCDLAPHRYFYDRKEGILQSPGYPNPYPPRQRCAYFIGSPDAKKIRITFQDVDVDARERTPISLCYGSGASLAFYDQPNAGTCIKSRPANPIELTTDRAWVYFQTNWPLEEKGHKGFKLSFKIDV